MDYIPQWLSITVSIGTLIVASIVAYRTNRSNRDKRKSEFQISQDKQMAAIDRLIDENKYIMAALNSNTEKYIITNAEIASIKVSIEAIWMFINNGNVPRSTEAFNLSKGK